MTVKQIIKWIFDDEIGIEITGKRYYKGLEISQVEIDFTVREKMKALIKEDVKRMESLGKKVPTKYSKLRYSNHLDWMITNSIDKNVDTYSIHKNLSLIAIQACKESVKEIIQDKEWIIEQKELTERLIKEREERRKNRKENLDYIRFSKTGTDNYISVSGVNDAINEYLSTKDW
jgi:hypothetical protein